MLATKQILDPYNLCPVRHDLKWRGARMADEHSLNFETQWFKATARGWGLVVLVVLAALAVGSRALGWV